MLPLPSQFTIDRDFDLPEEPEENYLIDLDNDYRTASTHYMATSDLLKGPGTARHTCMKINMRDASRASHELDCLLDTGASANCMSKSLAKFLESGSSGLIRRIKPTLEFQAANGATIKTDLAFKGTWNFTNRAEEYTHHFYLIDGLPTDVVISCPTIFQYGFLMQNPDLLSLGLPSTNDASNLVILGFKKLTKGQ
ncbi:hypothetical protein D6C90_03596 [Aureobasidium pullulans]|uniref:Peptidase A2 domain-containing protein n=1 Tax=Aureobasidium pullulans TaxID=5580 RepID=A0A4S9VBD7_AURPU|nr:hypothetical protein D6C90_03596 [Aureobasidium pullulans]